MTERHLRCGADGCHFTCCCTSRHDRLGCLRRHVIWHLNTWDTNGLPPRNTIQLLDELELENDKLWGATPKNENAENEIEVSNSSRDGDNAPNDNGTKVQRNNGTKVQRNNGTKVQRYDGTTKSSCGAKPAAAAGRRATLKIRRKNSPSTSPREPKNLRLKKLSTRTKHLRLRKLSKRTKNLRLRRNTQQLPSQLPDFSKKSKLPLHMGLPPSQVPFTSSEPFLVQMITLYSIHHVFLQTSLNDNDPHCE